MSAADRFHWLLATGCGLGLAPVASGTFGTVGGVVLAVLCQLWLHGRDLAVGLSILAALLLAYGCTLSGWSERVLRADDPKPFVLDEIVGYLVTIALFAWLRGEPNAVAHVAGFFAFRAFDVLKIYPADRLEHLRGAPGIMLDDVAAGAWAGVVLCLLPLLGLELSEP